MTRPIKQDDADHRRPSPCVVPGEEQRRRSRRRAASGSAIMIVTRVHEALELRREHEVDEDDAEQERDAHVLVRLVHLLDLSVEVEASAGGSVIASNAALHLGHDVARASGPRGAAQMTICALPILALDHRRALAARDASRRRRAGRAPGASGCVIARDAARRCDRSSRGARGWRTSSLPWRSARLVALDAARSASATCATGTPSCAARSRSTATRAPGCLACT